MNEFKAGDVVEHPERGRGFVYAYESGAKYVVFGNGNGGLIGRIDDGLRRLAVVDPESAEETDRLWRMAGCRLADFREQLREYVKPTPEPLAEPSDLAARVIDYAGDEWAQSSDGQWRCLTEFAGSTGWDDLARLHGPLRLAGGE